MRRSDQPSRPKGNHLLFLLCGNA